VPTCISPWTVKSNSRMHLRKNKIVFCSKSAWLVALCVALLPLSPLELHASNQKLERVKIAFVYKFLRLIELEDDVEKTSSNDLTIGVAGPNKLVKNFSVIEGKFIGSRRIVIKQIKTGQPDLAAIDALYLSKSDQADIDVLDSVLAHTSVLTITEENRDLLQSSMIVLYESKGYIRFDINNTLARSRGIKMNAKLLELAGEVK
jgi:hypothetical protein